MIRLTDDKLKNENSTTVCYDGLSLEQRLLLVNSDSMTFLLEELLNQELKLNKIYEGVLQGKESGPIAPYLKDQKVIRREITLQSVKTGTNHLYAESYILLDNLDPYFANLLLHSNTPIGKLWEAERIETFKVLELWGGEVSEEHAVYFGLEKGEPLIFRTYFVFTAKKLTMKITEKFPESWYRDSIRKNGKYKTVA